MKVLADVGDARSSYVATQDHAADPKYAAENVESQIARIRHAGCAGHRRAKRADNRYKARKNDCPSAIFLIEIVRALQMTTAKEERVLTLVQRRASFAAYPVSELVADNRAENPRNEKPAKRNHILARKNSCGH